MNLVRQLLLWWMILVLADQPVLAKKRPRKPAWGAATVYSNLRLEAETGDVGGMEVVLIPIYGGEWASVVVASGIAHDPVLVRVERDGPRITFTLPAQPPDDGSASFTGTITNKGLELRNQQLGNLVLTQQDVRWFRRCASPRRRRR